jgi:hypothetical protein
MTNWEKDVIVLNSIGVSNIDNVDKKIINYLKGEIKKRKKLCAFNHKLAGHLKEEYSLSITKHFSDYICSNIINNPISKAVLNKIDILNKNVPLFLDKAWINFQKKYEFNPLHDHTGLFSFIIFMQIPYNLEDEFKVFSKANGRYTSCLSFLITKLNGDISDITCGVDKSYIHKMLIFPAKLKHLVYPFYTSNKERITISGNVKFLN